MKRVRVEKGSLEGLASLVGGDEDFLEALDVAENEEAPRGEAMTLTTEEVHGGLEATGKTSHPISSPYGAGERGEYGHAEARAAGAASSGGGSREVAAAGEGGEGDAGSMPGGWGYYSEEKNAVEAIDALAVERRELRRLAPRARRMLEELIRVLGETPARLPVVGDRFDFERLMLRPYERKPLNRYRVGGREQIVVILDTSGSMSWLSRELVAILAVAAARGDVEAYTAPNGVIKKRVGRDTRSVEHEQAMRRLKGRVILYIGDFDGSDTPIILSQKNHVVWIAPELRYLDPHDHNWTKTDLDFKGLFIRVKSILEVERYIHRIAAWRRATIDPYRAEIGEEEEYY